MMECEQKEAIRAQARSAWSLYDELIEGIPEGICIKDYALGLNWSCVSAESGTGISYTLTGGKKRKEFLDFRGRELREMAQLARSWNMQEATLGIAALNAYYAQDAQIEAAGFRDISSEAAERGLSGNKIDAFDLYQSDVEKTGSVLDQGRAKVVVIGHFPHVEDIAEYADLVVLERNCKNESDTPDPACEYVVPEADFVFMTGVTLINKTAPRLLELSEHARTIMVGPSVVPSNALFDRGVETLATRVVADEETCMFCIKTGRGFGTALRTVNLVR